MADEANSLEDLKDLTKGAAADAPAAAEKGAEVIEAAEVIEVELPDPVIDAQGRAYATVNGRDQAVYFARPVLRMILLQPFEVTDRVGQFDVVCTVKGGGLSGQAGAVRHGISKALTSYEPALRPALKAEGFITRDSRVVERKKYGRAKARRSFQFSKR